MTRTSSFRSPFSRMLAGLTAAVVAIAASVLGVALPASAAGTASISGTVTGNLGGGALAGVQVSAYSFPEEGFINFEASAETAADGTFIVTGLPAGVYSLQFSPPDDTHLSQWLGGFSNFNNATLLTIGDGEEVTGADIELIRTGTMTGTVTDSLTGLPVEGVTVIANFFTAEIMYQGTAVTAADGSYTMTGLAPGDAWLVRFDGTALDYVEEYYDSVLNNFDPTLVVVTGAEVTSGIDATLDRAASISGRVVFASDPGVGAEGATVEVLDSFGNSASTGTDATGAYTVGGLVGGAYRVRVSGVAGVLSEWYDNVFDGLQADTVNLSTPGQAATGIDFALDAPGTISGVITGPDGQPLAGAVVEAISLGSSDALSTTTDENGGYTLTGVAPIEYRISASVTDGSNAVRQFYPGVTLRQDAETVTGQIGAAVTGISFQLPSGGTISGRVTDEDSGEPLEGIQVTVDSNELDVELGATTNDSGIWTVRGLPTGDDYTIRFADFTDVYLTEFYDNAPRRSAANRVTVQQGSIVPGFDAALTKAATVSGRVVDEQGNGIADMQVYLAPNGSLGQDDEMTFTASDGTYEIREVRPGDYRLLVSDAFSASTMYRSEWFENAYDPAESDTISISGGQVVTDLDVELIAITEPQYPNAPTITEVGGEQPGIQVTLPDTGPTPYGANVRINFGNTGETFEFSVFDDGFWGYADEGAGYDGHALVTAQSFGADGLGPATRKLVEVGAPPAYPVRPIVSATAADGDSVDVEWSIPQTGDGVDFWAYDVYSVDQPGEPYLQSYFEVADDRFGEETQITGLEPNTSYDLYVMGWTEEGDVTYWGEARLTTTSGPAVQALTPTPTPTIAGGPRIGGVLTAATGTWGPAPVTLARQWLRDGTPIPGATGATYAPTVDDLGAEISVRVTVSKTGYLTQSRTSQPTSPVVDLSAATPSRLAGADRYATAAAIAEQYPADVPVVYLATGRGFPDALSAASAAAALGGPLLITEPTSIPSVIADQLQRLNPARVIIVGGTGVVSTGVQQQVQALLPAADVERQQGADRYATSRAIARGAFTAGSTPVAYLATGRTFPDALAASAAAGAEGAPVILVNGAASTIDAATSALLDDLEVNRVYIAGGTGAVSAGIQSQLSSILGSSNVVRLSGADRYQTAVAINDARFGAEPTVYLATGLNFPDALAGAALAGLNGAPLYVVPGRCVPTTVLDSMARRGATDIVKFGGPGVLTSAVAELRPC